MDLRPHIAGLPGSKIREVANAGLGRSDVLPFWFGESDEVTPEAVRQAAAESLARGETFYSHNLVWPSCARPCVPTSPVCTATRGPSASPSPRRA